MRRGPDNLFLNSTICKWTPGAPSRNPVGSTSHMEGYGIRKTNSTNRLRSCSSGCGCRSIRYRACRCPLVDSVARKGPIMKKTPHDELLRHRFDCDIFNIEIMSKVTCWQFGLTARGIGFCIASRPLFWCFRQLLLCVATVCRQQKWDSFRQ